MAKYVVIYQDERKDDLELDLLKGHVEHLRDLHSQGILILCGPLKNSDGKGLLIFESNSQEEVESCVLKDPFINKKWYASYRIYEWIEANDSNNWLA
ncbi:YciI family protein [Lachnoclostridium sp.]|uniref:YciI family protein n=1 Tax=Lachnoclostridium sp. TaxID=2028282 RepID=UPI0028968BA8|nr:YciI family protein [Lachnoclostridium sp.]